MSGISGEFVMPSLLQMFNVWELKSYLNLNLNLFLGLLRLIASEVYGRMRPTHER